MLQAEEAARPACEDSSQVPLALEMRTLPPSGSGGAPLTGGFYELLQERGGDLPASAIPHSPSA